MKHFKGIFLLLAAIMFTGCATYKLHIKNSPEVLTDPADVVRQRIILIGDAGEESVAQKKILRHARNQLSASASNTVLFLGDNIYPSGLAPKKDTGRFELTSQILESQMRAFEGTGTEVFLIPGNHDWRKGKAGGLDAVRRQYKYVKNADIDDIHFLPKRGCPGPEEVELDDRTTLILIDTQWWLQDWSKEKDINKDCDARSRLDFLAAFGDALKDNKEKQVIVAMHHPLFSSGPHGGYFSVRDYLLPIPSKNWLVRSIPIPLLYPVIRGNFGHVQDIVHHKYYEMKQELLNAAQGYENIVFVSGHEHVLEYHKTRGHHFIVSGAGARHPNRIGKPKTMQFGHGESGYMMLDLLESGDINLTVWEPGVNEQSPVYQTTILQFEPPVPEELELPDADEIADSTTTLISTEYAKSSLYRFLFGERYRALYNLSVKVPNINLAEEHGGLVPVKKGGGFQTNSLRLEAPDGRQYVLRGLNKDASRLLPQIFQSTFAMDILQDQFTASHPYAAFVIPEMAAAAGIYHTNPKLVHLPVQEQLGKYALEFGGQMYLYEERPDDEEWADYESFGNSEEILSYSDMLEEFRDEFEHQIDQRFVLRSRLFDMLIGDWDRHDDQWRWAEFDVPGQDKTLFRPIPRDRDQAFSTYDGLIVRLANWYSPELRKMSTFTDEIKRIKWFNYNARWFDRDFLNEMTRDDFIEVATDIKERITDEVIESSLRNWPSEIFAVQGQKIIDILKGRRDNLPEFAARYYDVLAKVVYIHGTDDADYLLVTRLDGATRVQLFDSNKEGDIHEIFYDRTFFDDETRNIQIYGLDGRDHFHVEGDGRSSIKIQLVGGDGRDEFLEDTGLKRNKLVAYDTHNPGRQESDRIRYVEVEDDENNEYDRYDFEYDYTLPLFILGGNPDDGLLLGGGAQFIKHGFKKEPYASSHSISGFYAFGSGSYGFNYEGEWKEVIDDAGFGVSAKYQGPTYVQNFFGFGNDSEETVDDIDFYRVRKRSYGVLPSLIFGDNDGHQFMIGAGYESNQVEMTSGRFVSDPDNGLPDIVFDELNFVQGKLRYQFQIVDHPMLTRRGVRFHLAAGIEREFDIEQTHRYLESAFAAYFQLKTLGRPVIATRVGGEVHGGEFQFYQGAILGAMDNFRGVRRERFVGNKLFYHNTDVRFSLFQFRSYYLPAALGVTFSFDHGRVWLNDEQSDTWHYAYGGDLWFSPFRALLLSAGYHVSDVDQRFNFRMGFFF